MIILGPREPLTGSMRVLAQVGTVAVLGSIIVLAVLAACLGVGAVVLAVVD